MPWQDRPEGSFLYEKLFELAERNPKYESILNKVDSDYNGNLVPFNNGLYNIDEDILLPYTEFIFQTTIFNCRYDPSIRSHPVEDIYKRIIPDEKTLNFFYEAVGYTLFHKGMNPPSVFLIYGPGNTGKSALRLLRIGNCFLILYSVMIFFRYHQ